MFTHPRAASVSVGFEYGPDNKCETVLVVTTKLRINLLGEGGDDFAVDNLTFEALAYKNEHKIDRLRIISTWGA